jgi:alkanesulfonate monooxygenase SsuD/methylene tetrahydromethanopterin reductase-like flavin-dependent oxidoreductase (luciferase family)
MRFGVLYNIDYHEEVHGSATRYYGAILDQVVRLEELGYDAVWFGEHHYAGYSFGAPATIAVAAAARTSRIRVGTGVSLVPLHHPLRLAEEYAMVDVLSGGRLEYGIGRGFLKSAYDLFGVDTEESTRRFREGTEVILAAWRAAGAPFDVEGEFWSLRGAECFPPPVQQPHPPVYASGAATLDSYLWAAQQGLNLATAFFLPRQEFVRDGIRRYREGLAAAGHDPASRQVLGVIQMYCARPMRPSGAGASPGTTCSSSRGSTPATPTTPPPTRPTTSAARGARWATSPSSSSTRPTWPSSATPSG